MVAKYAEFPDEMSEMEYRRFALSDPQGHWELVDGRLREKPAMSMIHGKKMTALARHLLVQLDERDYEVRFGHARLRTAQGNYYVPDIVVLPTGYESAAGRQPGSLDAFDEPMPLVVEIWSPSTGGYDIDTKVPAYQARGDVEIWRLHPHERTLTTWVQQPDGTYRETLHRGGMIRPVALPSVVIDLDALFAG